MLCDIQSHSQKKITFFDRSSHLDFAGESVAIHIYGVHTYMDQQFHAADLDANSVEGIGQLGDFPISDDIFTFRGTENTGFSL